MAKRKRARSTSSESSFAPSSEDEESSGSDVTLEEEKDEEEEEEEGSDSSQASDDPGGNNSGDEESDEESDEAEEGSDASSSQAEEVDDAELEAEEAAAEKEAAEEDEAEEEAEDLDTDSDNGSDESEQDTAEFLADLFAECERRRDDTTDAFALTINRGALGSPSEVYAAAQHARTLARFKGGERLRELFKAQGAFGSVRESETATVTRLLEGATALQDTVHAKVRAANTVLADTGRGLRVLGLPLIAELFLRHLAHRLPKALASKAAAVADLPPDLVERVGIPADATEQDVLFQACIGQMRRLAEAAMDPDTARFLVRNVLGAVFEFVRRAGVTAEELAEMNRVLQESAIGGRASARPPSFRYGKKLLLPPPKDFRKVLLVHELPEDGGRRVYIVAHVPRTVLGSQTMAYIREHSEHSDQEPDGQEILRGLNKLAESKKLTHLAPVTTYAGRRYRAAVFELATRERAEVAVYTLRIMMPDRVVDVTSPRIDRRAVAAEACFADLEGLLLGASNVPADLAEPDYLEMDTDTPERKQAFVTRARALFLTLVNRLPDHVFTIRTG